MADPNAKFESWYTFIHRPCAHEWQPVSMVFETQLLDDEGRVKIRQPALRDARCYVVCMKCLAHTYVQTHWPGYFIASPDVLLSEMEGDADDA